MTTAPEQTLCPVCGGDKQPGQTTFTVDLGFGVVVVRRVPATVCSQCGEDWIDAETARRLDSIVAEARRHKREVEILSYDAAPAVA